MQRKAIAEYDERKRREAEARRLRYLEQRKKASSKASKSQNTTDTGAFSRLAALSLSFLTSAPSPGGYPAFLQTVTKSAFYARIEAEHHDKSRGKVS